MEAAAAAWPPLLVDLPREILLDVLLFLPAQDVARAGLVCRHMRGVANEPALWRAMFHADLDSSGSVSSSLMMLYLSPKLAYQNRLAEIRRLRAQLEAYRTRSRREAAVESRKNRVVAGINGVVIAAVATVPVWALVAVSHVAAKLDGGLAQWSWWAVLWPLWAMLTLLGTGYAITFSLALQAISMRGSPDRVDRSEVLESLVAGPITSVVRGMVMRGHGRVAAVNALCLVGVLFALPVTIVLKLQGVGGHAYNWGTAFLPLWLAFILHAAAPVCRSGLTATPAGWRAHATVWATLLLPALALFVTLAVSLDGAFIRLYLVLIPLWILAGVLVLIGILSLLNALYVLIRRIETPMSVAAFCGAFTLSCAVVLPPILFAILLCLKVDDPNGYAWMPWRNVFGPLFFWFALLTVASIVVGPVLASEHVYGRWRMAHPIEHVDPFDGAPSRRRVRHGQRTVRTGA